MWGHHWLEKTTISRYKTGKKTKIKEKLSNNTVPLIGIAMWQRMF